MDSFEEIKTMLRQLDTQMNQRFDDVEKRFDAVDARLSAVEEEQRSQRETVRLLGDKVVSMSADVQHLTSAYQQHTRDLFEIGHSVAASLAQFGERLDTMLSQAARARTQDLERMLRFEELLRRRS